MEVRDYAAVLPKEPPEGTLEWVKKTGAFSKEYMIYRAEHYTDPLSGERTKGVRITCTACGYSSIETYVPSGCCHNSYAPAPFGYFNYAYKEDVISGGHTVCPECGAKVEAKHIGNMPGGILQESWCMTVGRVEDRLVLFGWLFRRQIDKRGESRYWSMPYEAYVVEEKRIVRLMGYQKCLSSISLFGHWEQRKQYLDVWGLEPHIAPWDPGILQGTTAENSKLDLYLKAAGDSPFPVSYLRFWQKRKNVENLVMQGAGYLVAELLKRECARYSYMRPRGCPKLEEINWKEKRPAQMLGLNKDEYRVCVKQKWKAADLAVYKDLRQEEALNIAEDMPLVMKYGAYDVAALIQKKRRGGRSVMQCLRYLEKQNRRQKKVTVNGGYLRDYWSLAEGLGEDLEDLSVRFPKDLVRQHDRVTAERDRLREEAEKQKREEELRQRAPLMAARAKQLAPYAWQQVGILIRPAADEAELIREGSKLSHCVARYAENVAKGTTAIFFIRRTEAPEEPWYTLQLNEKDLTVVQNRGKKNCDRTEAVTAFEKAWLQWLREQRALGRLEGKKPGRKPAKDKKEVHAA